MGRCKGMMDGGWLATDIQRFHSRSMLENLKKPRKFTLQNRERSKTSEV